MVSTYAPASRLTDAGGFSHGQLRTSAVLPDGLWHRRAYDGPTIPFSEPIKTWLAAPPSLHSARIEAAHAALGHYLSVLALVWTSPLFAAILVWQVTKVASNCAKPIAP